MIIGLDVGGTHTDVVLLGDAGLLKEIKIPTDPGNLFRTVLKSLEEITRDIAPGDIRRIVLSTTLTTNAIAQKKLPPVGMIVTAGPGLNPDMHRTNHHYHGVAGSIDHRGREIRPVDESEVRSVAASFKQAGIRFIGVVGKFSVRNPGHEIQIGRILRPDFEQVFMGHQVSGGMNFPRRIATTYLNAAVFSVHREFFDAVRQSLEKQGLQVPIYILKADGGTMSLDASMEFPGQTILSGPAASVMGSLAFAPPDGEAVMLDIGGTTTDLAVIRNRIPLLHPTGIRIGGFRTLIRSLETRSIAIGGDSAVEVIDGELKIGPERHGPAMAFGGPLPTPTDALFVLKEMHGGSRQRSENGMLAIARALDRSLAETALEIIRKVCRSILGEAAALVSRINKRPVYTVEEIQHQDQLDPRTLLVLGGPAPYFARHFETLSGYKAQVVPRWQVANAVGAALARTTCEVTLFADTELGAALAPEEDFREAVGRGFSVDQAVEKACGLLRKKALQMGAFSEDLAFEVLENQQFSMVRGFSTTGRNIRVKVQVKPGLIQDYDAIDAKLSR